MPASVLSDHAAREMEDARASRNGGWFSWSIAYDDKKDEYYIGRVQSVPRGASVLVTFFAPGRYFALDKSKDIIQNHHDRYTKKKGKAK